MKSDPNQSKPTNYWDYIRVEDLLELQGGLGDENTPPGNDEVLFITVHQIFELWFMLIHRELTSLRDLFDQDEVPEQQMSVAVGGISRVSTLLKRCADHFEVMETLSTRAYLGFRDKLMPASGFQSAQLRQIEILLGLDDGDRLALGSSENYMEALRSHDGSKSTAFRNVESERTSGPSIATVVERWLYRTPIDGLSPGDAGAEKDLERFVAAFEAAQCSEVDKSCEVALARAQSAAENDRLCKRYAEEKQSIHDFLNPGDERSQRTRMAMLFIVSYQELPLLAWPRKLLDGFIELEQSMVIFRQRHARMVERVIGQRIGTGGSSGVHYLDQTALKYRIFKDLWSVRTFQIRETANPDLLRPGFYGFSNA
jgi:tryptophan 2,3-dioxygenase